MKVQASCSGQAAGFHARQQMLLLAGPRGVGETTVCRKLALASAQHAEA